MITLSSRTTCYNLLDALHWVWQQWLIFIEWINEWIMHTVWNILIIYPNFCKIHILHNYFVAFINNQLMEHLLPASYMADTEVNVRGGKGPEATYAKEFLAISWGRHKQVSKQP
jgi:hypothetical protein